MSDQEITDLTGIEYFPNLTDLQCWLNSLTELDLSKCTQPIFLLCSDNRLTGLKLPENRYHIECGQQTPVYQVPEDADITQLDLSTIVTDWGTAENFSVLNGRLDSDGKTLLRFGNAATSTVTYQHEYYSDMNLATMNVTLTIHWPYLPEDNSNPSYSVWLPDQLEGGELSVKKRYAEKNEIFRFTVTPHEGYEVETVSVTNSTGQELDLEYAGSGEYSFKMPARQVYIAASFRAIEPEPLPFTDVDESSWYGQGVRYAYENGLMRGISGTTFGPNVTMSRAMIATILWRMAGSPVVNYAMDFADVTQGQWYTEAIRWAASEGIMVGYGNGAFGTNDPITLEQLAMMLWNCAGRPAASSALPASPDEDKVGSWAVQVMAWATEQDLIANLDGALTPQSQITRAQAAVILMQFAEKTSY